MFCRLSLFALCAVGSLTTCGRAAQQNPLALLVTAPAHRDVITGSVSYQIEVTNQSVAAVPNVRVTDVLPDHTVLMDATNSDAASDPISTRGPDVVFSFPQINGSQAVRMTLAVLPTRVGPMTNIAALSIDGRGDSVIAETPFNVLSTQLSIHDPSMAEEDGTYYLFSSGPGIMFYKSRDMVHWEMGGRVFPGEPAWAKGVAPRFDGREWAPDIIRHAGIFYLYYAISAPGENSSAIGLAVNKTLNPASADYRWEDKGIVLESIPNRDLWNAIDPNIIVDRNGAPWMDFGSFWGGIKLVKLAPDWRTVAEPEVWYSLAKRDRSILDNDTDPGPAQIEGPFIFRKDNYYYLFVSWGLCCRGTQSTYKIMMGRSKDLCGPYLDKEGINMAVGGGSVLLDGDKDWAGQGGCSAYTFNGKDYLVFHAYEMADNGLQKLRIAQLDWDKDGWPVIDKQFLRDYTSVVVKKTVQLTDKSK